MMLLLREADAGGRLIVRGHYTPLQRLDAKLKVRLG